MVIISHIFQYDRLTTFFLFIKGLQSDCQVGRLVVRIGVFFAFIDELIYFNG